MSVNAADSFDGTPLSSRGTKVCVGTEAIQVFTYETNGDRDHGVGSIDPHDPSHVGSAIVEWIGNPQFWTSDRAIVLYAGRDSTTVSLISKVLGEPFAKGQVIGRAIGTNGCS